MRTQLTWLRLRSLAWALCGTDQGNPRGEAGNPTPLPRPYQASTHSFSPCSFRLEAWQLCNGAAQGLDLVMRVKLVRFGASVTGEPLADLGGDTRVCEPGNERMPQAMKTLVR